MQTICSLTYQSPINAYRFLMITAITMIVSIVTTNSHSAPGFETPDDFTPATCPSGHKMYYVGANPPAYTPIASQALSWTAGSASNSFTFNEPSGNKVFNLNFNILLDLNSNFGGTPPFFGSINGATVSAINLIHNSPVSPNPKTNHALQVSVNRTISKVGYRIQDVDSVTIGTQAPYVEQLNVATNNGRLTFNPAFHTINAQQNIVSGIRGQNCSTNACNIDAIWNYSIANTLLNLSHINQFSQIDSPHAAGYSDFYFCLAPPKVIVRKQLSGTRVNDSATNRDQFVIRVNNGATVVNSFTTTGTGATVTNDNSGAVSLAENTSYTITEQVTNNQNNGDILNYNAAYSCTNATTGSTTVMPTAAMTYNAAAKTRSFTLANTAYGDEITCTISNSPFTYNFSGIVFEDNGGIIASNADRQNISATFTGNASYFNGAFDSATELGIFDNNLTVRLTDCNGTNLATATASANPQTVSNIAATRGRYNFVVPASVLVNRTRVCLVEGEPSVWDYTIDTTLDSREVTLVTNVFDYKTERDGAGVITRNLDFGEVRANNTALVLIKSQYVHTCNDSLDYQSVANSNDPTVGFSINPISGITPGNCIAYRIQAYNRGHVSLQQIQIRDQLQSTPVASVFRLPAPLFIPTSVGSPSVTYGTTGVIQSNQFTLAAVPPSSTQPSAATLYFNTKYNNT